MNITDRTRQGMSAVLSGDRRGIMGRLLFVGPAVIASIAYSVVMELRQNKAQNEEAHA